jgi:hypothetical protein
MNLEGSETTYPTLRLDHSGNEPANDNNQGNSSTPYLLCLRFSAALDMVTVKQGVEETWNDNITSCKNDLGQLHRVLAVL